MLARLRIRLKSDEVMSYNKSVILQSIIMNRIDEDYAVAMHESGLHPYSQYLIKEDEKNIWNICVTSEKAYKEIIIPMMDEKFEEFEIVRDKKNIKIIDKTLEKIEESQFMEKFYFVDSNRYINIIFKTPTAFKQCGKYVFYPDVLLLYQSLMNKFDAASTEISVKSEDVLEEMVNSTMITRYNLHSHIYNIGSAKIPAFMGNITLKINGAQAMVNFANMLFKFGEFSGIGIKTAMGMGSIEVAERKIV